MYVFRVFVEYLDFFVMGFVLLFIGEVRDRDNDGDGLGGIRFEKGLVEVIMVRKKRSWEGTVCT